MSNEPSIEQIKEAAKKLFQVIGSDPGALSLGPEVRDAAWELHYLLNNPEDKIKNQAENPHDHQDYCMGCQSMTEMWIEDVTRCEVCREKYPDGY
jgi:hypothetical protein